MSSVQEYYEMLYYYEAEDSEDMPCYSEEGWPDGDEEEFVTSFFEEEIEGGGC